MKNGNHSIFTFSSSPPLVEHTLGFFLSTCVHVHITRCADVTIDDSVITVLWNSGS